jgi:hypothetical protein
MGTNPWPGPAPSHYCPAVWGPIPGRAQRPPTTARLYGGQSLAGPDALPAADDCRAAVLAGSRVHPRLQCSEDQRWLLMEFTPLPLVEHPGWLWLEAQSFAADRGAAVTVGVDARPPAANCGVVIALVLEFTPGCQLCGAVTARVVAALTPGCQLWSSGDG